MDVAQMAQNAANCGEVAEFWQALELAGRPVAELLQHNERFARPRSLQ
jgi:hypothetical protein